VFLPDDGKRKKAVVKQTHSRAYEAAALRIAAVSIFAFFHSTHDLHQLKKA